MKTRILFFSLTLFCTSLFAQVNLSEGLISQYSMDEADWQNQKLLDLIGNNDIYTSDAITFDDDRNGGLNGAYRFAGSETNFGVVNEQNNASDLANLGEVSLAFWHIGSSIGPMDEAIFYSYIDQNGNGFTLSKTLLFVPQPGLYLEFSQLENSSTINSFSVAIPTDQNLTDWNHFGFIMNFNEGELSILIDGAQKIMANLEVMEIGSPKMIYGQGESTFSPFINCFDEVHLYDRLLSEEEIFTLSGATTTSNIDLENKVFDFKILPNPVVSNRVSISSPVELGIHQIELYNELGALIQSKTTSNNLEHLSMDGLVNGLYFIRVKNGSSSLTKKLIYQGK